MGSEPFHVKRALTPFSRRIDMNQLQLLFRALKFSNVRTCHTTLQQL
jgi:hypothetical protein